MVAKLGDLIGDEMRESINGKHKIEIGNVYKINMNKNDGVYISDSTSKAISKYFVVVGSDSKGNVYGGVLVSSNLPTYRNNLEYQYPIKQKENPFLAYNSYINCTTIFSSTTTRINAGSYIGCLDEHSLYCVIDLILDEDNPTITPKEREIYNIERYDFPY